MPSGLTFANSGGGFFPRHRLERAHTAFLVVVRRLDLASSLKNKRYNALITICFTISIFSRNNTANDTRTEKKKNTHCCREGRMLQLST